MVNITKHVQNGELSPWKAGVGGGGGGKGGEEEAI